MNDMEPAFGRPRLPAIQKTKVANCYISLTLDIRDEQRSPDGVVHACIRFNIDRSRFYVRLPEKFTREEYLKMVSATGRGRKKDGKESLFEIRV